MRKPLRRLWRRGISVIVISRMFVQNEVKRKDIAIIEVVGASFQRQFRAFHTNLLFPVGGTAEPPVFYLHTIFHTDIPKQSDTYPKGSLT